jgi:hypothetical protein
VPNAHAAQQRALGRLTPIEFEAVIGDNCPAKAA